MVKRYFRFLAAISFIAAVSMFTSGCAKKEVVTTEKVTAEPVGQQKEVTQVEEHRPVQPIGTEESLVSEPAPEVGTLNILEGRTTGPMLPVYFDFDKSNIRQDQKSRIEANADHLKNNPNTRIVIEGNCDERGTNEYNMALGERRAISGKKYLVNLGISSNRINTISYGEERPLNHGHDELAWSQNRRDDFVEVR